MVFTGAILFRVGLLLRAQNLLVDVMAKVVLGNASSSPVSDSMLERKKMDLFAQNDEVARLEAALFILKGEERLACLLSLAWYLRQSDAARALSLIDEIGVLLPNVAPALRQVQAIQARIALIQGEIKWLQTDMDSALQLAEGALHDFTELADWLGVSDAHLLLGLIEVERGMVEAGQQHRVAAALAARKIGDQTRGDVADAAFAFSAALVDVDAAWQQWQPRFSTELAGMDPVAVAAVFHFFAVVTVLKSEFGRAAAYWMHAYDAAILTGQIRRAVTVSSNIGDAFNNLNDPQGALEWMQRGLDLARQTNWPGCLGLCLAQTGETLRRLGHLSAAQDMLEESLSKLEPIASSRSYAIALAYLAQIKLDQGEFQAGLQVYQQLQHCSGVLKQSDFECLALRAQAYALLQLAQPEAAVTVGLVALEVAERVQNRARQVEILCLLAQIHRRYSLPEPDRMQAMSPVLHYLLQARKVYSEIDGCHESLDVLDGLAQEYARLGQFEIAWQMATAARQACDATQNQEATHRAIAMQVQQQTERTRADSEHHRQLALAEAKRAEVLQQTSATLERLSAIGQEITAQLDRSVVFDALNRHVHSLLDTDAFMIFLRDPDGTGLNRAFGSEQGRPLPASKIAFSNMSADSIRCLRERREIERDFAPDHDQENLIPGTLNTLSALFAPLIVGDRVLGVMSVQSMRRHAFGERERLVFRTLCAYGAIALDNASAYQQLQQAQHHMMVQEKLAALGGLVAGVAHELNTPIGNCLMIATAWQERMHFMRQRLQNPVLQRSELIGFIDDAEEASAVMMRGLTSAADLVSSFKQVAVDRTTAQRRTFDLAQTTHEIIATMTNQIKIAGHRIGQDIPPGISLTSFPGPYGQVITNFINNALLHAFDGRSGGHMQVSAQQTVPGRVSIQFSDDGIGISEQNQRRIFEPFFTTKMGQGGSGLGLSISYTIVSSLLNGQVYCESRLGRGTTFTLDVPLVAQLLAES